MPAALLYVATPAQQRLLASVAPGALLAPPADSSLGRQLAALAAALPGCNVRTLDVPALATAFFPHLLPPGWRGRGLVVPFTPGQHGQPSLETLQLMWEAVAGSGPGSAASGGGVAALAALAEWPLLPAQASALHAAEAAGGLATAAGEPTAATSGRGPLASSLCSPGPGLLEQGSWAEPVATALAKLGCRLVEPPPSSSSSGREVEAGTVAAVAGAVPAWVWRACVQPATGAGALAAIAGTGGGAAWREIGAAERDALRAFLLQVGGWAAGRAALDCSGPLLLFLARTLAGWGKPARAPCYSGR